MLKKCLNVIIFSIFLFCAGLSSVFAGHFDYDPVYPLVGGPVGTPYPSSYTDIARDPGDIPSTPLANNGTITITAQEVDAYVAPKNHASKWAGDGTDVKFEFFAFGGGQTSVTDPKVPGPFLRVKQGNTVTVKLTNNGEKTHSIDLHAVLGKKGGAAVLTATPGETVSFTFVAKNPGIYLYHCVGPGTPHGIAMHQHNGMNGLILVEPNVGSLFEAALPDAKEFYIMEQDIYYNPGTEVFDEALMLEKESPDYVVYNGRVGALVDHPLQAQAGKHVIIYHAAVGQHIPSFHIIGEIFDVVWNQGDLTSTPLLNIQTTLIPSSGVVAVGLNGSDLILTDLTAGDLNILVDHAWPCFRKGALGLMTVSP